MTTPSTPADPLLVDMLRRVARALDLRFGMTLWEGTDIPPASGEASARIVIADEGALASLVLGSVATQVLAHCKVPVLLVR